MSRGGRQKERDAPERRCIVTRDSGETRALIRFVIGPDAAVVPDLAEKLPGRGLWVSADRDALIKAVEKNLFAKAARQAAAIPDGFVDRIEAGLVKRLIEAIAICRKAGLAVAGAEKVRAAAGAAAALLQAADGSEDGKRKIRGQIGRAIPVIECLSSEELGLAFGRASAIHAVLAIGGATDRALREAERVKGLRNTLLLRRSNVS